MDDPRIPRHANGYAISSTSDTITIVLYYRTYLYNTDPVEEKIELASFVLDKNMASMLLLELAKKMKLMDEPPPNRL